MIVVDEKGREVSRYLPRENPAVQDLAALWERARQSALSAGRVIYNILAEVEGQLQQK